MKGKVYLIGAGPGDPGLITVKGLGCLQEADLVVYDRLVDRRLIGKAKKTAELKYVGKGAGETAMDQEEINRYLVQAAQSGKVVVRLKGGDPFVFGRGGEEAQALAGASVPFEIVPGVTSAVAAPAYAGIPLTHRDMASSFTVVSGSEDPSKGESAVRWDVLAREGGTLVVLMGWGTLDTVVDSLLQGGMDPDTPAALVRWGTEPYQHTVTGTLMNIASKGRDAGLNPPVVAVIGQVVDLRAQLRWFDNMPLFGKRVLVTRSRSQASALSELLAREGAEPIEVPTIQVSPLEDYSGLDAAISSLHSYSWVIFTSTNGVEAFYARIETLRRDSRVFSGVRVGAIGPATAEALAGRGVLADFVPSEYVSEAMVREMDALGLNGARVLLPRSDIGREELTRGLAELGAQVDEVPAYRTVVPEGSRKDARSLLEEGHPDVVTFTSSSTVVNLLNLLDEDISLLNRLKVACIGPITARTAQDAGLTVDVVPHEYTIPGLVGALKEYFSVLPSVVGGS